MNSKKIIIISGGSKGLGSAMVKHFLSEHNHIATFSRSKTNIIEEMESSNHRENFFWEEIDGKDYDALNRFTEKVIEKWGKIDALINNVGVAKAGVITMVPSSDIKSILDVNLGSAIHLTQACVKNMLIQRKGNIINISSIVALRGFAGLSIYTASKAALEGMTRSLARELGPRGIRVNAISPGFFESDITATLTEKQKKQIIRRTPIGRLGNLDDIVGVVGFLLSPSAEFMTGHTIVIDGGLTC